MSDKIFFLLFILGFAGCTGVIILESNDRERCEPICIPYAYARYVNAQGECVCDTTKIVRK